MSLQALIFDVDGTLADTERDGHRPAFNLAFQEAGLDWFWDVQRYGELLAVAGGKERILHYVSLAHPELLDDPQLGARIASLHQAKTRIYVSMIQAGRVPLRTGIRRLIAEARGQGLRLAIATTTTPDNVVALLENGLGAGSASWFECIAAGDIVAKKKPAPDIYQYALSQMGLGPLQALAVEDSGIGLAAARGAGLPTVVTINDYTRDQAFEGALAVLPDFGEPGGVGSGQDGEAMPAWVSVDDLREWHRRFLAQV